MANAGPPPPKTRRSPRPPRDRARSATTMTARLAVATTTLRTAAAVAHIRLRTGAAAGVRPTTPPSVTGRVWHLRRALSSGSALSRVPGLAPLRNGLRTSRLDAHQPRLRRT